MLMNGVALLLSFFFRGIVGAFGSQVGSHMAMIAINYDD